MPKLVETGSRQPVRARASRKTRFWGSVATSEQGRENSRCIVPPSCGEQVKLLDERQLLIAGIFRLLFTHHMDQLDSTPIISSRFRRLRL